MDSGDLIFCMKGILYIHLEILPDRTLSHRENKIQNPALLYYSVVPVQCQQPFFKEAA